MNATKPAPLGLIRFALFLGVLLFAAVSIYFRTTSPNPEAGASQAPTLAMMRYITWGLVLVAIIVANVLRGQVEGLTGEKLQSRLMIGWAMGEIAALTGGVQYFNGGTLSTMIIGIVGFAVVLLILRIPATRQPAT